MEFLSGYVISLLGYISLEIITISQCNKMYDNLTGKFLLKQAKIGYKVKFEVLNELAENKDKNELSKFQKGLISVCLRIPFINIITINLHMNKKMKEVEEELSKNNGLIEMNEKEKEEYSKIHSKQRKIGYLATISREKEHEGKYVSSKGTIVDKHAAIISESLTRLSYTLDEIMELTKSSQKHADELFCNAIKIMIDDELYDIPTPKVDFRVGKLDGFNVALIGVIDDEIKRVRINGMEEHEFEEKSLDEMKDSKFIVYPIDGMPLKLFDDAIEEIRKKRMGDTRSQQPITYSMMSSSSVNNKPMVKTLTNPDIPR